MAITAKKIAEKLNLSPSAVSLALNGKPGVSDSTRELVLAEAERLGYAKQKVTTAGPQNIRFVIFLSNQREIIQETTFYSYILQGIEKYAKRYGYNVLVSYYRADEDSTLQLNAISSDVTGLIILGTSIERSRLKELRPLFDLNLPMVLVDNYIEALGIDCVVTDNYRGSYNATKYLLGKGYTDLGYLRSKSKIDNFRRRQEGFFNACKEAALDENYIMIDVGISSQKAYNDMSEWLNNNQPPRALLADNDVIATACTRALKAHGYRIPEDVAVIGFDNMPLCSMVEPPLTAIDVDKEMIGKTAVNLLHNRIAEFYSGAESINDGTLLVYVSTKLVERETT